MGSWYRTCCVSNLPIMYGNKVRMFFVMQKPLDVWWGRRFVPVTLPVQGRYADYGNLEEVVEDTYVKNHFAEAFGTKVESVEDAANKVNDKKTEILPSLIKSAGNLHIVMCHEDIFQEVVNIGAPEKYRKELRQFMDDFFPIVIKDAKERGCFVPEVIEEPKNFSRYYYAVKDMKAGDILYKMGFSAVAKHAFPTLKDRADFDWEKEFPNDLRDLLTEAVIFGYGMDGLRRDYNPEPRAGSQDVEYEDHIRIAKATIKLAQNRLKEFEC